MKSLNRVELIGRIGQDPEVKYTAGGTPYARFSVATDESWTKDGERQEKTTWHNIVAWGKLGEIVGQYAKKGGRVFVSGALEINKWEDQEGNKRESAQVNAREFMMLDGGKREGSVPASFGGPANTSSAPIDESDIPF